MKLAKSTDHFLQSIEKGSGSKPEEPQFFRVTNETDTEQPEEPEIV